MNSQALDNSSTAVCGTFSAAKMLGMSVGTVQSLVERGELQAWKTKGGHRRISLDSIRKYQRDHGLAAISRSSGELVRMLVVDDDPVFLALVEDAVKSWNMSVQCSTMSSAIEALMTISSLNPHVLVTDLRMPEVDGFDFIIKLRSNPQFDSLHIIAVTSMTPEEIQKRGGLPRNVVLMSKPLDIRWLHGFTSALWSVAVNASSKDLQA